MKAEAGVQRIRLQDYRPPAWLIPECQLRVSLPDDPAAPAVVESRLQVRPNPQAPQGLPLRLDGDEIRLLELLVDGRAPEEAGVRVERDGDSLLLHGLQGAAELRLRNEARPEKNTRLMGLYRSSGIYCSQCEPEGFRRITYFSDRPDVLCRFSCRIEAPASLAKLLSNGDLVEAGPVEGSAGGPAAPGGAGQSASGPPRHYALWRDPHPKPAYLFALVAGDLEVLESQFTTASGREVLLQLYAKKAELGRLGFALEALRDAMRWDEEEYGREYDLDRFMIVAVDDFNFGAMENKGLNIYNSAALLADPTITTDAGFARIRGIVAHEYFHNWSGNRVTLRDWFQLCLKEGFTVFRDQSFSESVEGPMRERLRSVDGLRRLQFREDAGALSHPVRPETYARIDNFYTYTVYEKGAELVRMQRTLLGGKRFRQAAERFFDECDGSAATVEDLLARTCDGAPVAAADFLRWYRQPGTPLVRLRHGPVDGRPLRLDVSQQLRGDAAPPLPIPLRVAAFAADGRKLPLRLADPGRQDAVEAREGELCLLLREREQAFVLDGLEEGAALSVLRGFSAPVRLDYDQGEGQLALLAACDDDPFVRWESGQRLMRAAMAEMLAAKRLAPGDVPGRVVRMGRQVLARQGLGGDELALMLAPPSDLAYDYEPAELDAAAQARDSVLAALGGACRETLEGLFAAGEVAEAYNPGLEQSARRAARILALELLAAASPEDWAEAAYRLAEESGNLTERLAGLRVLSKAAAAAPQGAPARLWDKALARYEDRLGGEPLAMDHWMAVQASQESSQAADRVRALLQHPLAADDNPNRMRAILGSFCRNTAGFHAEDGSGYRLVAEQVRRLDGVNPMLSSVLVAQFGGFRQLDAQRRVAVRAALEGVQAATGLSRELAEQLDRILAE